MQEDVDLALALSLQDVEMSEQYPKNVGPKNEECKMPS